MWRKLADKINGKIRADEEEITFKKYDDEAEARVSHPAENAAPAAVQSVGSGSVLRADNSEKDSSIKFKLVKPQGFDEVGKIADHLIEGCTVVLNTELLDMPTCRRMLDFLNGVTYSIDGDIKNVSKSTFIITPNNVDVSDNE